VRRLRGEKLFGCQLWLLGHSVPDGLDVAESWCHTHVKVRRSRSIAAGLALGQTRERSLFRVIGRDRRYSLVYKLKICPKSAQSGNGAYLDLSEVISLKSSMLGVPTTSRMSLSWSA
jgi:hypothetical protein